MATIAPTASGAAISPVAVAGGGDAYANSGVERVYLVNGNASACVVTFNSQQACNQGFDHDTTVSVPAGQTRLLPAVSKDRFNDPATGLVGITYSVTSSVTIAVLAGA